MTRQNSAQGRFTPLFSSAERRRAVTLYMELHSLQEVADELGRSPSGVYKILQQESCRIISNAKVKAGDKDEIQRLYYNECCSGSEIAQRMHIAKTTANHWIKRLGCPIPEPIRLQAGTGTIRLSSGMIDLLPFVEPSHLRWADSNSILLRKANSHKVVLSWMAKSADLAYVLGFYLAEGNKGKGPPELRNTCEGLLRRYHTLLKSIVRSEFRIYDFPASRSRMGQRAIRVGGECMKCVFINGIKSILASYSNGTQRVGPEVKELGLMFLRGCADGDGSVSEAGQAKTTKSRVKFYITEGNSTYAMQLRDIFRNILGSGSVYHPKNRNYYLVIASLSPERAALLLAHGFFSQRGRMKERLAAKALDSRYLARLVRLYSLFGASSFSRRETAVLAAGVTADFVGKAVFRKDLLPVGVIRTGVRVGPKWYRRYSIAPEARGVARCIADSLRGGTRVHAIESSISEP